MESFGGGIPRQLLFSVFLLSTTTITMVSPVRQQVSLSDSYLPVAMQIIAHLTDQMSYEVDSKTTSPPRTTTPKPSTTGAALNDQPISSTTKSPYVSQSTPFASFGNGWWMAYSYMRVEQTTPFHKPGFFAPVAPPKPGERVVKGQSEDFLLPMKDHDQVKVIEPTEKVQEPLLSIQQEEITPIMEPKPQNEPLLPPKFEDKASRTDDDDWSEENLQLLSPSVRELISMSRDPEDRLIDIFRKGDDKLGQSTQGKLSSSNLRLLLLYDLLSRDAKKQKLNDYAGFSASVLRDLVETSSSGPRVQLSRALSRMVDRGDCTHEYANNRAREMIIELGKDTSVLSREIRNLQPLVYSH